MKGSESQTNVSSYVSMLTSRTILVLILLVLFSLITCRENEITYVCDGILQDKSLPNIRTCITGSWQVHYMRGGFDPTRLDLDSTFLVIKPNDSIYYTFEGTLIARTRITWKSEVSITGIKTYTMFFSHINGGFSYWVVNKIVADTLSFLDNSTEPYGYHMTRLNQ